MNAQFNDSATPDRATDAPGSPEETRWTARKLSPAILVYVLLVFAAFMALSQFVFHSTGAVRTLAVAAIATLAALLPQALSHFEYRADERGVKKRSRRKHAGEEFRKVFDWDELSHVIPTKHGYKYYLNLDEKKSLMRSIKLQISDRYSGEIQVAAKDRSRIRELLAERDISLRRR